MQISNILFNSGLCKGINISEKNKHKKDHQTIKIGHNLKS